MHWMVVIGIGWLLLAVAGAVVIGRSIHAAEHHEVPAAVVLRPPRASRRSAKVSRRPSASRAVSGCLSPVDRSPSPWENETT
ncbi:hypothetical protein ACI784_07400 [Geodermatophilus sp. SYSU D01186]